jgi:hypothetical protein
MSKSKSNPIYARLPLFLRSPFCFVCKKKVENVLMQMHDTSGVTVMHPECARPFEKQLTIAIIERLLKTLA